MSVFPFILTAAGSELNLWSLECEGVETRVVKNFDWRTLRLNFFAQIQFHIRPLQTFQKTNLGPFFTRSRWLADNFPLDNFPVMELVRGEVVRSGTCPGGSCPGGTSQENQQQQNSGEKMKN